MRWTARSALAALVVGAAAVAWRDGGGADPRISPPHASPVSSADAGEARGAEGYQVRTRFVDAIADAQIDVPGLSASRPYFQAYWRKVLGPWSHPAGIAGQLVTTISLRNGTPEKQLTVPIANGNTWTPDARVWNMNEGSYDQREALFAPTPSVLAFHTTLPPNARLDLAPAVATRLPATTVFDVEVVDAGGVEHAVSHTRVPGGDAGKWHDLEIDLSAWGGETVDVKLRTSTDVPSGGEKRWSRRDEEPAESADGEADEPVPVPPMSLALWGDPIVVAKEPTRLPYNVLWIVVDALRPDVAAGLHDAAEDTAKRSASWAPLEALLPAVPGLMPGVDALAAHGVHFTHAWSAGAWTRPGTLSMLAGERSGELGIDPASWILAPDRVAHYYASSPPMLPLILRRSGAVTAAFVNNFFMAGYATVGVDTGFERVTDHRYRTRDTAAITRDATSWLDAHAHDRFFLFANYNSPHEPYDPPADMLARIPPPPAGPRDAAVRGYMAEGAKDDAAIAELLAKVDALGLTATTLVIVTSDHGETLSSARTGYGPDHIRLRFHHAVGNFEETTRVPIVMALPGVLDGGRAVADRVRNTDIAPTVLDVEGLEADPRMSGRSMLPLVRGKKEPQPRVVMTEGRGSRAILWDKWRLIAHDPVAAASPTTADAGAVPEDELYDMVEDPGEHHDVARKHPDIVAGLRARLDAAMANVPAADAPEGTASSELPAIHMRFAGAGRARRVACILRIGDGRHPASGQVQAEGIDARAIRVDGPRIDFALTTSADAPVGVDVRVDPPAAPVTWELYLDDKPWPDGATFAGPFGLPARAARSGIEGDDARAEAYAPALPVIDPSRDLGVFVTRDRRPGAANPTHPTSGSSDDLGQPAVAGADQEMRHLLEQWGYAHPASR